MISHISTQFESFACFVRAAAEPTPETPSPPLRSVSYADLYVQVFHVVQALKEIEIKPGDRIASYSSNCIVSPSPPLCPAFMRAEHLWVGKHCCRIGSNCPGSSLGLCCRRFWAGWYRGETRARYDSTLLNKGIPVN